VLMALVGSVGTWQTIECRSALVGWFSWALIAPGCCVSDTMDKTEFRVLLSRVPLRRDHILAMSRRSREDIARFSIGDSVSNLATAQRASVGSRVNPNAPRKS